MATTTTGSGSRTAGLPKIPTMHFIRVRAAGGLQGSAISTLMVEPTFRGHDSGRITNCLGQGTGGFTSNLVNSDANVGEDRHIVSIGDFNGGSFASNFGNGFYRVDPVGTRSLSETDLASALAFKLPAKTYAPDRISGTESLLDFLRPKHWAPIVRGERRANRQNLRGHRNSGGLTVLSGTAALLVVPLCSGAPA